MATQWTIPSSLHKTLKLAALALALLATLPAISQQACRCTQYAADQCEACGDWYDWYDCRCQPSSPIIIDTRGNGIRLTSPADGVLFDLRGTGTPRRISWTQSDSGNAFLVLDRNGNGTIDDGTELFGDRTPQPPSSTPNGFLALAKYDKPENGGNGDGIIDEKDAVFTSLRLWIDSNHNGISEPSELFSFAALGLNSISLQYRESSRRDEFGNVFRYRAKVQGGDGIDRWAYDVFLTTAQN